ncbi:MAG: sulfatase [Polyangiaceae bacterium]
MGQTSLTSAETTAREGAEAPAISAAAAEARAAGTLTMEGAQLAGAAMLAMLSGSLQAVRPDVLGGGLKTRLLQGAYPAGYYIALGLLLAAIRWALRTRVTKSTFWTPVAMLVFAFTLGWTVLKDDFLLASNRLATTYFPPVAWRALFTLLSALILPAGLLIGQVFAHPRVRARLHGARFFGVFIALGYHMIGRDFVLPTAKPGFHLILALGAAVWLGSTLDGAVLPSISRGPAAAIAARLSLVRKAVWILAVLWAAAALLIRPPMQIAVQMMRPPAAALAPFALQLHAQPVPADRTPAEVQRLLSTDPAAPPSGLSTLPKDGAVLLITIDCLRADLVNTDRFADALPNMVAMRREGASFTSARSAASYTMAAITAIFAGRYESQLAWQELPLPYSRYRMPALDPAPRFPELLGEKGVRSVLVRSSEWLGGGSGMVRGFTEEVVSFEPPHFALAERSVDLAIDRIEKHPGGPLFLYLHFFDAHYPYDRGGKTGTTFEQYVREVSIIDAEVGRLTRAFDAKFPGRGVVMFTADHGEAFGEHGSSKHGTTLYDEVIRVPLVIRGPGIAPRTIAEPVSTMDLGPTILDLYDVPTPSTFMSRTLLPALAGQPLPARPIGMEANNVLAVYDGSYKIIRRRPYDTIELYDLRTDPDERRNLYRERDRLSTDQLRAMDRFFADVDRK